MKNVVYNKDNISDKEVTDLVVRTKGLLISNGYLLLGNEDGALQFPGGHLEENETLEECLEREILEEIGADTEYVKSSSYVENFFELKGKKYHEILIVHEMKFCDESMYQKEVFKSIEERKKDKLPKLKTNSKKLELNGKTICIITNNSSPIHTNTCSK